MKHFITILCTCVLLLCSSQANSQVEEIISGIERQPVTITDTLGRNYDTLEIETRQFDNNLKETYNGAAYNYDRVARNGSDNFLSRFISWVLEGLSDIFGFVLSPLIVKIITYLFYFLIGMVVLYFILRFVGSEGFSKVLGKNTKAAAMVNLEETHIEELDIDAFIADSLAQGNYRNALRYQYLLVLKALSIQELIAWDFQKTNADYYREIKDQGIKDQFKNVSRIYDYVWYGEFPIAQDSYEEAMKQFNLLTKTAA
jgi:phage shock protein PspC (stress-responsive transcriptional regulator)